MEPQELNFCFLLLCRIKVAFLVLDIETGDYEIDDDDLSVEEILRVRRPDGVLFGLRIGCTSAYTLAGRMVKETV